MNKAAAKQVKPVVAVAGNYTITLHRADHPGDRSSYTIPGRAGNVVFANTLFKGGKPPASITLGCELVEPKVAAPKLAAPKATAATATA